MTPSTSFGALPDAGSCATGPCTEREPRTWTGNIHLVLETLTQARPRLHGSGGQGLPHPRPDRPHMAPTATLTHPLNFVSPAI